MTDLEAVTMAANLNAETVRNQQQEMRNLEKLAIFGRMVLEEFREAYGDVDGGWLQDTAVKCGLLTPVEVTPENICRKASDMGQETGMDCPCDVGDTCYRLTDAAKAVTVTEETSRV